MGCACRGRTNEQWLWYPTEESALDPVIYKTEVEARAKVMRKGGAYVTYDPNMSVMQNIVVAEQARKTIQV